MRIWSILLALLALGSPPVSAEVAKIRTGDHEGFSRIVFHMPARVETLMDDFEDGFIIRFETESISLDASAVFLRMAKSRIRDIQLAKTSKSVFVNLNCECKVESFWHGSSMYVVDVIDAEATGASRFAKRQALLDPDASFGHLQPGVRLPDRTKPKSVQLAERVIGGGTGLKGPASPRMNILPDRQMVSQVADGLFQQLGRAASQGLLTARTNFRDPPKPDKSGGDGQGTETQNSTQKEATADASDQRPDRNLNVKATTSIDRDFLAGLHGTGVAQIAPHCLPLDLVDFGTWTDGGRFSQQLGPLRSALTNELDRPNLAAATRLVKLYLFHGFGIEARGVQETFLSSDQNSVVFNALAAIMDDKTISDHSIFKDQLSCDSPAALWAALSHQSLPLDQNVNSDAILISFSDLPRHLRAHLGPRLSQIFLTSGFIEESDQVLRTLKRVEETRSPSEAFAEAEHLSVVGGDDQAIANYRSVVETDSQPSALALVRMIDAMLDAGDAISYDVAQLAGAYAHERQSDELGQSLLRVYVLSLAASGDYDRAFLELDLGNRGDAFQEAQIRSQIADLLVQEDNEFELLRFALAGQLGDAKDLTPETTLTISQSLTEARFHASARQFLNRAFSDNDTRKARMLRAEISLSQRDPRSAEAELLGLEGEDANALRARAKSQLGQHGEAADLYASAGLTSQATRESWLARDWSRLAAEDNAFARIAAAQSERIVNNELGSLAERNALADDANSTKEAIEDLLVNLPHPQDL